MPDEIWVYLETENEIIKKGSLEVLSLARKLADDTGNSITAIAIGTKSQPLPDITAVKQKANKIHLVSIETQFDHDKDLQVNQLYSTIKESEPKILLLSATPHGREISPRLAAKLDAGLISDCVDLKLENGEYSGSRSMMHGKAQSTLACNASSFLIATVCPGIFDIEPQSGGMDAEIVRFSTSSSEEPRVQFLEYIKGNPATISLREADIIIAIGRGLEKAERMGMVEELAGLLNASIGGTRTAVDLKWLPLERQIGITGETVSPRLLISCGISGQYPHTVGMDTAETIIVINKDRDAPIFKLASLGIVSPMENIIPVLSRHISNVIIREEQQSK
jgi:electron transfer flavoprotein alpha subunit